MPSTPGKSPVQSDQVGLGSLVGSSVLGRRVSGELWVHKGQGLNLGRWRGVRENRKFLTCGEFS